MLNTSKSDGPNSIPNEILKAISGVVAEPLSHLCNMIFSSGNFPLMLKIAKVIPIYKKDLKTKVSNYRPISLLSNVNKIIEKLLHKRIYNFLENNDIIYKNQFGFRKNHCTNDAFISILEQIKAATRKRHIAAGVFVDFEKAFDTVNHEILLKKLDHYGIRGIANNLIRSYLSDRKQFVSINNAQSDMKPVNHGVPQGSVLGPLLFLLYINDLHECIHNSETFHFADDTHLLHILKKHNGRYKLRKLLVDLKSLTHWLLANKISLNVSKTELIYFRMPSVDKPSQAVKVNGVKIEPVDKVKYLGLTLDEFLNWNSHRNILLAKLKRGNNLLSIIRHYAPKNILHQVYYMANSIHI